MENKKILVVDDDPALLPLIEYTFAKEGYEVSTASDGKEALKEFFDRKPDLVILDIMMPRMDGWEACRRIREVSDVPIMMLTARGQDEDIVRGLEYGADDYLTKPFSIKVLLAHARAVLRRAALPPVEYDESTTYADDYLTVDLKERRITVAGETIKLTPTEYRLLAYLVQNVNQVLTFRPSGDGSIRTTWTTCASTSGISGRSWSRTPRTPSTSTPRSASATGSSRQPRAARLRAFPSPSLPRHSPARRCRPYVSDSCHKASSAAGSAETAAHEEQSQKP
jgi:DNA-binding response OmpR family regulator